MSKDSDLIGHQYALAMNDQGVEKVRAVATERGSLATMEAFLRVHDEEPDHAYLHSALCAMSLPAKRPKDEHQPIIREDGKYALAIIPKTVLQQVDGKTVTRSLGVPFGSYPRVVLIYLLSQAVKNNSRDVYLGRNFTEWMRKLGYNTISYGPRGSANLLKEQLDRLLACEWMIRWDDKSEAGESAFGMKGVQLSNEYAGTHDADGVFAREIRLSEVFYEHLKEHAVPLNEVAIRELRSMPTALDLYGYLAYRLPRISGDRGQTLSWEQFSTHMGNNASMKRFKQTIKETMQMVSSVYPNAHVDLSGKVVKLFPSPAPLEKRLIGGHLRLVAPKTAPTSSVPMKQLPLAKQQKVSFPSGSLRWGAREMKFRDIALEKGGGWDIDNIAAAFRSGFADKANDMTESAWLQAWEKFCISYAKKRAGE